MDSITFVASIAQTSSAIRFPGNRDGAVVVLEVPESEVAAVLQLLSLRETAFRVTVEPLQMELFGSGEDA